MGFYLMLFNLKTVILRWFSKTMLYTLCFVMFRHDRTVFVAHDLDVDPLVGRVGIAVIRPEEGTDTHFLAGSRKLSHTVGGELDYLAGTKLEDRLVSDLFANE